MSQYGSMPPPGPYVPPTQNAPVQHQQQQQQQTLQQPQSHASYQPTPSKYGAQGQSNKPGGAFNQMMNQAVTTGKPMLDKLSKTISSKLGNKPSAGPPSHLHSYQNYQSHHGQQSQAPPTYHQQPSQLYSPQLQSQQQQWGQPQHQQASPVPNAYTPPQQSPYQQSYYANPVANQSGQSNYFPQQGSQASNSQPHTPQPTADHQGYNTQPGSYGSTVTGQQGPGQQGPYGRPPAQFQQVQPLQAQYTGQQSGIVGTPPPQLQPLQSPPIPSASPEPGPQNLQPQWSQSLSGSGQPVSPLQQPASPLSASHPYPHAASPPLQQKEEYQQSTPSMAHTSPQNQAPGQFSPTSASPPPLGQGNIPPHIPSNKTSQTPSSSGQRAAQQSAPTEFIAELPADMGTLSLLESRKTSTSNDSPVQSSQYQAYNPPGHQAGPSSSGFTIPRRSVSSTTYPLADPWRFADPVTEVPTREFYILADLLFDALDRRFEPNNTGLLEASKILASWVKLTDDARGLFSYNFYSAFARLWSLEGIPHMMVPCQTALTPNWNFSQHSHAQELKIVAVPLAPTSTYMPALNRAGWYKFLFLESMHSPGEMLDLIPIICADTYKPGVFNHPDLGKRDTTDSPALQAKAAEIQTAAMARVCEETKAAMTAARGG